ncbi:MAG: diguanylate cyclase [Rubrivivax sp.]|nr:diguanylate cyclase [Rubrivivax sp.]
MPTHGHPPLDHVLDLLLDAVCVVDAQGRFLYVGSAGERIFGYTAQEMAGRPMIDLVFPADRARTLNAVDEIMASGHKPHFENRYVRKDGRIVDIMWTARWSEADRVRVAVARDVTELKRAQSMQAALYAISEAAHAAEDLPALFQRIHRIIGDLLPAKNFFVALYDAAEDRLTFPYHVDEFDASPAAGTLDSGTLSAEVIRSGQALHLSRDSAGMRAAVSYPDVGSAAVDWLGVPLHSEGRVIGALVLKSHAGEALYTAADTELLKFVSTQVATAIERKQAQTRLQHMARHDPLTDLPNRSLVQDRMATALARARRDRTGLSLLYLDLDRFKQVNDRFGHAAGDRLLQEVARRLDHCVRESDTVGRMGGDEFVVLLASIVSPAHAPQVAEKIRRALCQPFDVAGQALSISPSIGIAHYPEHGEDPEQLIRRADEAMYAAKQDGGNRIRTAGRAGKPGSETMGASRVP